MRDDPRRLVLRDDRRLAVAEAVVQADLHSVNVEVRVAESDMGRIIGREGRTVKAIRSILFAAGQKHGKRFHLDLLED